MNPDGTYVDYGDYYHGFDPHTFIDVDAKADSYLLERMNEGRGAYRWFDGEQLASFMGSVDFQRAERKYVVRKKYKERGVSVTDDAWHRVKDDEVRELERKITVGQLTDSELRAAMRSITENIPTANYGQRSDNFRYTERQMEDAKNRAYQAGHVDGVREGFASVPKPKPLTSEDALTLIAREVERADDPFKASGEWLMKFTQRIAQINKQSDE